MTEPLLPGGFGDRWGILGAAINVLLVLLVAPLFQGIQRRLTARVQSRRGPPLLQPYFDLLKLLGKEDLESGEAPAVQRFAAYLALASVLAAACLVPLGFAAPLTVTGDAILLVYLLLLSGVSTLLAGAAAGSTYSWVGVSREMMSMMALEPILAVALAVGALHAGSFQLQAVFDGSPWAAAVPISGVVMLAVMLLALQAFVCRVPFDVAEAETEIMDGPLSEYSGQKLALFRLAQMVKLVVYSALLVALFVPWGAGLPFPLGFLAFWAKTFVLVILVALVAATHARYRVDQAIRRYSVLLAFSLGAVVLAALGRCEVALSLLSKLKEAWIGLSAGTVTLPYPLAPHPPAPGFRGRPIFDASKCIGCGGCASNCPAREILIFDPCQELRVIRYLGLRCTSCGRCAEVCPEKAITMSESFELATNRLSDLEQRLTLFMGSCQRCGRCFTAPTPIDALKLTGYRVDDVETGRWVFVSRPAAPGTPPPDVEIEL